MEKNINFKKEKGITLVALVVTIIVLLILAFVAISMIMGDNGVVEKAKESKEETIKAQEREFIKLAYQDLEMDYRLKGTDITADRVMEKLSEYDKNIKVEMITKDEIGDTEVVVEKNSGEEYAEIVFTETEHKYAGSLVIDENKARYEVTYNANRGSGGPTKQVKIEGTPLTITLERPERKGYNFIGWARESTAVVAEYMSGSQYTEDANITLYAVWQMRDDIEPVAQIGSTKYPSIQEAIYDCSQAGEATTILLLTDTEEEFRTYEGQNIILNLQGHTVTSKSEGALCTNNGKLQIINGELRSEKGTAITNNGEITIGDNSNGIDDNTPTIYGNNIGVENKGTFNFYDGKIQGKVPIQGTTPNTPDQYGAVQTTYENGIATVQLRILTGYEARIGWVYYETLQGAIDIAKEKETVTLIKDLQLKEILQVGETKDVILDLYGYELTVASGLDTVIKNYGDLEITDNSVEQTGNITITSSSTCYGIRNEGEKTLNIVNGIISSNSSGDNNSYGIYNNRGGSVEIISATINSYSSKYSYGIYNKSNGIVKIIEGIINSSNSFSYAIYNEGSGIIEVKGGIVNSSSSNNNYYGIYNKSSGNIKITGGIINGFYGMYNNNNGNIEMSSGTINSKRYGIYNKEAGIIEITGGTINAIDDTTSYGIYNENNGIIEITEGVVNSSSNINSCGLYNKSSGIVKVTGGVVSSIGKARGYGINNYDNGKIIVGEKSETISKEKPLILGKDIGTAGDCIGTGLINTNGIVEFYNGIIQGNGIAMASNVTQIREGYQIESNTIEGLKAVYLSKKINTEYIVQIDETKYSSLQEAIDSINNDNEITIKILRDFEINESIEFNKNIVLDLNGHTITNHFYRIINIENLTLIDSSEKKQGKIEGIETICGIYNEGNIKVIEGTINNIGNDTNDCSYGIYNNIESNVEVIGGTISSSVGLNSYGIYNNSNGSVKMTGGAVSGSSSNSFGISNYGKLEVTGGTVSGSYGIYNGNTGTAKVSGGIVDGNSYGIYNSSTENIEVAGGEISGRYGIYNKNSGTVEVTDGTITSDINNSINHSYGLYNESKGIIVVSGGTIISNSIKSNSYGIYNNANGTITIGLKGDGVVSQENPYIEGTCTETSNSCVGYGIYNITGNLNFYDGKVKGTTKAVYEKITEKEENTEFNYNEDETILTLSTEQLPVAQIGDITYTDLQEAIDSVTEENTIIKILRNVTYTVDDSIITIPNTKNILLDLNGYKISSAILEKTIQNEGTLEIIDTNDNKTGLITTSEKTTIYNASGAELIISEGTIENRNSYAINNEGNLIIQGGTINSSNTSGDTYGIYNMSNGTIEMKGGIINSNSYGSRNDSYGIYNDSIGNIKVIEGNINSNSDGVWSNSYGIYNANSGNIEITGGMINSYNDDVWGDCYGVYNFSSGTIEIAGGIINSNTNINIVSDSSSNSYGIYNTKNGTIIIGIKGNGIVTQEKTLIKATRPSSLTNYVGYGIYNPKGTLYYYDGKIQGTDKAISGNIAEIEEFTEINLSEEMVEGKVYQTMTLNQVTSNVASVNGTEYDSIQKAIEVCKETESTIEILRDSNLGATIIIGENQNITIDLKGHTINNYTELQNKGTLKIIDTSTEQTGKIVGLTGTAISNTGTLEIQGGTIADSGYGIKNTGTVIVNGGNISNNTYGIYNDSNGMVNIEEGTITTNTYGIYNYASTSVTNVNSESITSNDYGIYNYNGTTNISSKGITNNTYGVYVAGGTTNIKEGAEIQSETGAYVSKGRLNIGESGTMNPDTPMIIGETYGLTVSATGTVYMYDGQIKGKEGATEGYITYTEEGYTVANKTEGEYKIDYLALSGTANAVAEVNGISYSNLQSAINSITGGEEETITLLNGITTSETYTIAEGQKIKLDMNGKTISSDAEITIINNGDLTIVDTSNKNVAKITSTTGVAIQNIGTLTLGEDEGTVKGDVITIEGETKGIENTGTLNIFDGTIIGTTAIEGEVNKTPSGYTITTTTVDGKQKATLTK